MVGSLGLGKGQLREAFKSFIDELEPKARVLIRWHPAKGPFPYGLLNGKIILECFKRNCKDAHQVGGGLGLRSGVGGVGGGGG